jgi:hypothetical protein
MSNIPQENAWNSRQQYLVYGAIVCVLLVFAFEFFLQDGSAYVSPDGQHYLTIAQGETHVYPYNVRLVKPLIVRGLHALMNLPIQPAYQLLTVIELTASLLLLAMLLRKRNATVWTQVSFIIGFGVSLGVIYGHMPVLVDLALLTVTLLVMVALDKGRLWLALLLIGVAALTKEYGVLLILVWAVHARRRLPAWMAYACACLPLALLFLTMWLNPAPERRVSGEAKSFLDLSMQYLLNLNEHVGSSLVKTLYIWLWAVLWPVGLLAILAILRAVKKRLALQPDQIDFAVLLLGVPLLLMGDWNRSLLLLVPFACNASLLHPLAQKKQFNLFILIGGVATAFNNFAFTRLRPPSLFVLTMIALSMAISFLILITIARSFLDRNADSAAALEA